MIGRIVLLLSGVAAGVLFRDDILKRARVASAVSPARPSPPPMRRVLRPTPKAVQSGANLPPRPDLLKILLRDVQELGGVDPKFAARMELVSPNSQADFLELYLSHQRLLTQMALLGSAIGRFGRAHPNDPWAAYLETSYDLAAQEVGGIIIGEVLQHPAVIAAVDQISQTSKNLVEVSKEFGKATETVAQMDDALGFVNSLIGFFSPPE